MKQCKKKKGNAEKLIRFHTVEEASREKLKFIKVNCTVSVLIRTVRSHRLDKKVYTLRKICRYITLFVILKNIYVSENHYASSRCFFVQ